jgi:hypothetical protein
MKKWHMEGIVSTDISNGHKIILPDESHMYGRIRTYSARLPKEGVVISMLRSMVVWVLRFF